MGKYDKVGTTLWVIEGKPTTGDKMRLASRDGVPCAWREKEAAEKYGRTVFGDEYEVISMSTLRIQQFSRNVGNEDGEIVLDLTPSSVVFTSEP